MPYEVLLTGDARRDLEEIHGYIAAHDRIEAVLSKLSTLPERGAHSKELLAVGVREYRETCFKPYRLIYRVAGKRVYIYLIADGRRDMQTLLAQRLLRCEIVSRLLRASPRRSGASRARRPERACARG